MTNVLSTSKLMPMEYVYSKLVDETAYNQSNQAYMSASAYTEIAYLRSDIPATNSVLCFYSAFR